MVAAANGSIITSLAPIQPSGIMTLKNGRGSRDDKGGSTTLSARGGAINGKYSSDVATATNQRSKLRNVLFPIYGQDVAKFLLVGAIKFFVIMALTLTRDNKDTMVVTECGAEAIAFLKVSA